MKKLGTLKVCPKCGSSELEVEFVPQKERATVGKGIVKYGEEYMRVSCSVCVYSTKEAPLDAEDNIESKGE